jgi:hypothetical protein
MRGTSNAVFASFTQAGSEDSNRHASFNISRRKLEISA